MIDIATLKREHLGKWVLYQGGCNQREKGRIKSWNDKYVFVVYHCDSQWDKYEQYTGCATRPEDLRFTTLEEVV